MKLAASGLISARMQLAVTTVFNQKHQLTTEGLAKGKVSLGDIIFDRHEKALKLGKPRIRAEV